MSADNSALQVGSHSRVGDDKLAVVEHEVAYESINEFGNLGSELLAPGCSRRVKGTIADNERRAATNLLSCYDTIAS